MAVPSQYIHNQIEQFSPNSFFSPHLTSTVPPGPQRSLKFLAFTSFFPNPVQSLLTPRCFVLIVLGNIYQIDSFLCIHNCCHPGPVLLAYSRMTTAASSLLSLTLLPVASQALQKPPRCDLKLALYSEGREKPKKEAGHPRLVGSRFKKQGNLHRRLVLGEHKTSRSLHPPAKS